MMAGSGRRRSRAAIGALTAAGLLSAAGAAHAQSMPAGMPMNHGVPAKGAPEGYDAAMAASMSSMSAMMATKPTGMPDRDFVAMMIPHHEGAVAMAKVQLRYGRDPGLLRLARSIVKDQEREIALMKSWQAKHPQ